MIASIAPPMVPSHVFLGDIFVSGVFPIKEPTIYAIVSFIQIDAIRIIGILSPKSQPISYFVDVTAPPDAATSDISLISNPLFLRLIINPQANEI